MAPQPNLVLEATDLDPNFPKRLPSLTDLASSSLADPKLLHLGLCQALASHHLAPPPLRQQLLACQQPVDDLVPAGFLAIN